MTRQYTPAGAQEQAGLARRARRGHLRACIGLLGGIAASAADSAGGTADAARALDAAPRVAQVLHAVDLPAERIHGLHPVELSALAWDPAGQRLWAASDRGTLFVWQVDPRAPERLQAMRAWQVRAPGQGPDRSAEAGAARPAVNAETLAWRPDARDAAGASASPLPGRTGTLWLGGEHENSAWQLDAEGRAVATQPWPGALQAADPSARHGIEAMHWHALHGLLAARQRPTRQLPVAPPAGIDPATRWHAVHGQGRVWWFAASHPQAQLKAIEALGAQGLLVLERVPHGRDHLPVLRWLALQGCGDAQVCTPRQVPFEPALPVAAHNYEGLACTPEGLCWMVSDAQGKAGSPTRLLVLRLQP